MYEKAIMQSRHDTKLYTQSESIANEYSSTADIRRSEK